MTESGAEIYFSNKILTVGNHGYGKLIFWTVGYKGKKIAQDSILQIVHTHTNQKEREREITYCQKEVRRHQQEREPRKRDLAERLSKLFQLSYSKTYPAQLALTFRPISISLYNA